MATTAAIHVNDGNPIRALQGFLRGLLERGGIDAILVPLHLPGENAVLPTLVRDPERLEAADPLAPAFPLNSARLLSRLTRQPLGGRLAAVLRPCEIRAFIELVKLKQASVDEVVIIGLDCLGAFGNREYPSFAQGEGEGATLRFLENALEGKGNRPPTLEIARACQACEDFLPEGADLSIGLFGAEVRKELIVEARSDKGTELLAGLGIPSATHSQGREPAVAELRRTHAACREEMFRETEEAISDLEKLSKYLSRCVTCTNCRIACPVCYCKECVFLTDVFDHESSQYLRWAKRKGMLRMPTDTVFFHLTRLAHMSVACVGCGQCSNACPNGIPVMELFQTIARHTQEAFDYHPGRRLDEPPPLSIFQEHEFPEVTRGKE